MKDNNKLNWYKRFIAIALCAFVSFAYMPLMAYAEAGAAVSKQEGSEVVTATEIVEIESTVPSVQTADDDELLMQFLKHEVAEELYDSPPKPGTKKAANKQSRKNNLTGVELKLYNELEKKIKAAASGELSDTDFSIPASEVYSQLIFSAEELGVEDILVEKPGGGYEISEEAKAAFKSKFAFDASAVTDSLLADFPYELYWFDKTDTGGYSYGMAYSYGYRYDEETDTEYLEADEDMGVLFDFKVSADYSDPEGQLKGTVIDTAKTKAAAAFTNNAATIILDNEDEGDFEKLKAYKDAICVATDYNHSAVTPPKAAYGNPWQLIWVFDNDPSTKVVCEGYSKAFQFLCDQSDFSNTNIEAYTVTGTMAGGTGAGGHMWNIMHMEDGNNYMVDITNCDDGLDDNGDPDNSIGYPDKLFMTGALAGGSVQDGYMYDCDDDGDVDVTYIYDEDTTSLFATEELTMSTSAYVPCQHNWQSTGVTKQASCTEAGAEGFECSKCHATKSETIAALGHDFTEVVPNSAVAPTCTEAGKEANKKCSRCDEVEIGAAIAAKGHTEEVIPAVAATCTEAGNTAGKKCSVCKEILEATTVIPALGHDFSVDVPNSTVAPTCTEPGKEANKKCSRCDEVEIGATIAAKGHTEEVIPAVAATCTEAGNTAGKKCSVCKEILEATTVIPALGHDFSVDVPNTAVAPTCTENGKEADKKCSRCNVVETGKTINAPGHTPTATDAKEATCEEAGNNAYWTCSSCKKVFKDEDCTKETTVEDETIGALNHNYGDWEVLDEKQHVKICSRNNQHILKENHTWDAGKETVSPEETTPGEKTFTCTKCPAKKTEPIPSKLETAKANAKAELAKIDVSKYSGAERTAAEKAIKEALEKIDSATSVEEVTSAKNAAVSTVNAQKTDAKKAEEANAKKAEAAAKRAADREGTVGAGMPKVKLKKLTAKKNKITIKWTKLTAKQLKKSKATSYEIWVSTSNKYPEGETTKEKILKKGKSSWTCTGLKKNTKYYVKIRAIKYVNGAKVTGKWKQKTIKTKKK